MTVTADRMGARPHALTLDEIDEAFDREIANGGSADQALHAVQIAQAELCGGSPGDYGRRSAWAMLKGRKLPVAEKLVLLAVALGDDLGEQASLDVIAHRANLKVERVERAIGALIAAGMLRASAGRLALDAPVTPGRVAL